MAATFGVLAGIKEIDPIKIGKNMFPSEQISIPDRSNLPFGSLPFPLEQHNLSGND